MLKVKNIEAISEKIAYSNGWYKIDPINQIATCMFLEDNCTTSDWLLIEGVIYVKDTSLFQVA